MPTSRETLKALVQAEPYLNQAQLARRIGISRERVRQLVRSEGLITWRGPAGIAPPRVKPAQEPGK